VKSGSIRRAINYHRHNALAAQGVRFVVGQQMIDLTG
jgi:hypothetical protein